MTESTKSQMHPTCLKTKICVVCVVEAYKKPCPIKPPSEKRMTIINEDKLRNIIAYFMIKTAAYTEKKLSALLFVYDFKFFSETGKSSTGLSYIAQEEGPVPRGIELQQYGYIKSPRDADPHFNIMPLTRRELQVMKKIASEYEWVDEVDESVFLKNRPWHQTSKGSIIPYALALDNEPGSLTETQLQE